MTDLILEYLAKAGYAISLFAVAVIVVGFAIAAWSYVRRFRKTTQENNFEKFKVELGSVLLLSLDILVLADVIETITVAPSFQSLALLAAIVILRTAVSWSLTLQTKGHWPWQTPIGDQERV